MSFSFMNLHTVKCICYLYYFNQSTLLIYYICLEAIVDSSAQAELNLIDGTWEWNIMTFLIYE